MSQPPVPLPPEIIGSEHHGLDPLLLEAGLDHPFVTRWAIRDDGAAEWAMRKLVELRRELDEQQAKAAEWTTQIVAWLDRVSGPLARNARFFEERLERYQLERRLANPDHKTLVLPSGTVSSRPATSEIEVSDELLKRWQTDRPDLVRVKVEPAVSAIRDRFVEKDDKLVDPETGEIVEGATVHKPTVPYTLKVKSA